MSKKIDLRKIPKRERWLYRNKKALAMVRAGLRDVKAGRVVKCTPKHLGLE